jgi:hypothetical protein
MYSPGLTILVAGMLMMHAATAGGQAPSPSPSPPAAPGTPAPDQVVTELQQTLTQALQRFERRDIEGVLHHVSDRYRTGPLTKSALRQQLTAMVATHDALYARVRIDEVRMIGDRAWVYSSGEITGRLRMLGTPTSLFSWKREPEVAWREGGRWRLIGDQQS